MLSKTEETAGPSITTKSKSDQIYLYSTFTNLHCHKASHEHLKCLIFEIFLISKPVVTMARKMFPERKKL